MLHETLSSYTEYAPEANVDVCKPYIEPALPNVAAVCAYPLSADTVDQLPDVRYDVPVPQGDAEMLKTELKKVE